MEPLVRPAHLDAKSPKQGLLSYHMEQTRYYRQCLTEQMLFDLEELRVSEGPMMNPTEWWTHMLTLKWEDGSICAIWRDRMVFHEQCVKYLLDAHH